MKNKQWYTTDLEIYIKMKILYTTQNKWHVSLWQSKPYQCENSVRIVAQF